MARFLWLRNTAGAPPDFLRALTPHRYDLAQQYALARADLGAYDALVLSMYSDQRQLQENRERLLDYLAAGGAVIFNGHVAHPFLPGLTPYRPVRQAGLDSLRIRIEGDHPLTQGLGSDDLTFQRRVAGFYSRGGNPPPQGATVLTSIGPDRVPVDWIARYGRGQLFVHAGNDIFPFLRRAEPERLGALRRFFDQFERVMA